jgi:cysteine sulfinate desulfinase/cysteine desulfurase-like protein
MIVGVISVGVMTVGVLSVGIMTLSQVIMPLSKQMALLPQKKILFHVDLIKMLSLIPVIFSSKFRIAKIHVLPFQVIKSSHS